MVTQPGRPYGWGLKLPEKFSLSREGVIFKLAFLLKILWIFFYDQFF